MEAALIGLLVSFAAPVAVGHLLLGRAWPSPWRGPLTAVMRSSLALGLGLGVVGVWVCVWGEMFGIERWSVAVGDAVLVGLALLLRETRPAPRVPETPAREPGGQRGWLAGVAAIAAVSAASFVMLSMAHPHGDGDAVLIWNMRAHFLLEAWGRWDVVLFPQGLVHVDYPLLLPALVARAWVWAGDRTVVAPAVLGAAFTFATSGVLLGGLAFLRGRAAGALATIALLGTPFFVEHGADQAADVPLAFFVTAALALLLLHRRLQRPSLLALLGLAAGCAAWTKNEGMLWALLLLGGLAFVLVRRRRWGELRRLGGGAALPLATVAVFKLVYAPANDLGAALTATDALARVTDVERWQRTLAAAGQRLVTIAPETWLLGSSHALLMVYAVLAGRSRHRLPVGGPALVLLVVAATDVVAFVVASPYELDWHLRTAMARLVLQLWPATLLIAFAWLRVPGDGRAEVRHA